MSDSVYDLFQRGKALLEGGDFHAATVPLSRARDLDPDKTSIREALGRALFHAQRYSEAAEEFETIADSRPTDDFALFCWGRSLQLLGRHHEARALLAQAARLRPERRDYEKDRQQGVRGAGRGRAQTITVVERGSYGPPEHHGRVAGTARLSPRRARRSS